MQRPDRYSPQSVNSANARRERNGQNRVDRRLFGAPRTRGYGKATRSEVPCLLGLKGGQGVTLSIGTALLSPRVLPFEAMTFLYQSNESFGRRFWLW